MNQANQAKGSFGIERIYVKDISFESLGAPQIFTKQWQPQVNVEITSRAQNIADSKYEVVLELKIVGKQDDTDVFITEIEQAGLFHVEGIEQPQLDHFLGSYCPNILYPYAREVVDTLSLKGSIPPLMLGPVNFDQLFAQRRQQQQPRA